VKRADVKLLAQIVFSAVLLSMCAWIILSGRYPDDYRILAQVAVK